MSDFYNKYPYTDFHELNLDWIIERVKQLTEDWLETKQAWEGTEADWQELYSYVHDYFDNLDVQNEINAKIDEMILDGTFATIATPIIDSQVADTVAAWLAEHITPTTPAVDNTLTVSGAAADSKTVGDRYGLRQILSDVTIDLDDITTGSYNFYITVDTDYPNHPEGMTAGVLAYLEVFGGNASNNYQMQRVTQDNGNTFIRRKSSGWTSWIKISGNGTLITDVTVDFDDLVQHGEYEFIPALATDFPNHPPYWNMNVLSTLFVFGYNSTYPIQLSYSDRGIAHFRRKTSLGWNDWESINSLGVIIDDTDLNDLHVGYYNFVLTSDSEFDNHPAGLQLNVINILECFGHYGTYIQRITNYYNEIYVRMKRVGGWTAWERVDVGRLSNAKYLTDSTIDLDTLLTSGTYRIVNTSASDFPHHPDSVLLNKIDYLMVYGNDAYDGTYPYQLYYTENGMYFRRYSAGSWRAWQNVGWTGTNLNSLSTSTDLNELPLGMYQFALSNNTQFPNHPSDLPLSVICYLECEGADNYQIQKLTTEAGSIYVRRKKGAGISWTDWVKVTNQENILDTIGIFHTIGVVGDSLASGYAVVDHSTTPTTKYDFYDWSWPQVMKRKLGTEVYNFTKMGLTTRTWLDDPMGNALMSDGNHVCQAYIIGLGVNDDSKYGIEYIGTSADIDINDYTQNADTFYGNYGRIISLAKIQQPHAKIFVLTMPSTSSSKIAFNEAIRDMANIFSDVYVVDLPAADFAAGTYPNRQAVDGHYSPAGYSWIATYLMIKIANVINTNASDFYYASMIGSEWDT